MIKNNSPFLVLYISNVEATYKFYSAIGAEINQFKSDKVVLNLGGHDLHFILESTEPFPGYQYVTNQTGRGQGLLIYVEVNSIDNIFEELKFKDIKTETSPKENAWGYREFLVEDPDGFKIVFWGE